MFRQPQNTNSPRDTANDTMHMVFKCELDVKLHAKDVEVGLARIETKIQNKVAMRRVHSNGSTDD